MQKKKWYSAAASGPVRLFTPYKRRRRNQISVDTSPLQIKQKKPSEEDEPESNPGIVTKEESTWQTIADGIDASNSIDYIDPSTHSK